MKELLLGCGSDRRKKLFKKDESPEWEGTLVTLDVVPTHKPDVVWDLNERPLPFPDNEFDRIHAYEVLEHIGYQGDWRAFFEEFSEYWRILKNGGELRGTCPRYDAMWAWGDPSHTRVITNGTFTFLSQENYKDVGRTTMTDFRGVWKGDFKNTFLAQDETTLAFILEAIK